MPSRSRVLPGELQSKNSTAPVSRLYIAPVVMGRIIESGATASEGFHRGFLICGVVSLVGGLAGMAFLRPEAEAARFAAADAIAAATRNRLINAELAV
jgi:MFS transporter, ACS family, D-galactonate transporter